MIATALLALAAIAPKSGLETETTTTYHIYESHCNIAVYQFLAGGCLGATMSSWSYGNFSLNASTPAGLPSGGEWAMAATPDYGSALWLLGSFIFPFGDLRNLSFYVYNSNDVPITIRLTLSGGDGRTQVGDEVDTDPIASNAWTKLVIPFSTFGKLPASQQVSGMRIIVPPPTAAGMATPEPRSLPRKRTTQPPLKDLGLSVFITDMSLTAHVRSVASATATPSATPSTRVASPLLFGANFAVEGTAYTSNRWGGNVASRYSWDLDAMNHAADWFFEGIPETPPAGATGSTTDRFIKTTRAAGAKAVITLPTIGWSPKDNVFHCGFSVSKYGKQNATDPYNPDCGNGRTPDYSKFIKNEPNDTSKQVGPEYVMAWLEHLQTTHGEAMMKESIFILDNEPNYWPETQRDVHPQDLTYEELWGYTLEYATKIKAKYPTLHLAGPDLAGYQSWSAPVSRTDGSTLTTVEALLIDLGKHAKSTGLKLLDTFDIHCYPEGQWNSSRMTAEATVTARMHLTRELWDKTYYSENWAAKPVAYLRWISELIAKHAPWLDISCTEWNYQQSFLDSDVPGAVISLDALGWYVREGVTLAHKWQSPAKGTVIEYAIYHFLHNSDGKGRSIAGSAYVPVTTDTDMLGAHAFTSDAAFQLLIISKQAKDEMSVAIQLPKGCANADVIRLDAQHTQPSKPESLHVKPSGKATVQMPPVAAALVVCELPTPVEATVQMQP